MNKWMLIWLVGAGLSATGVKADGFTELNSFGANPGELTASYHAASQPSTSLVVLLHGCGQDAQQLAQQSGFYQQAKIHNFSLLLPQQQASNNATTCFNWFSKADQEKGKGETQSMVNMIEAAKAITKAQDTYIVGLSAGGAFTSSLLVHYPEMFKAGAIVAGIPFPCADNLIKAISCMKSGSPQTAQELAQAVHRQDQHKQSISWPSLTVISGSGDKVVNPKNSELMAEQWGYLTGTSKATTMAIDKVQASSFGNGSELIVIPEMGHGMPVNPDIEAGGSAAPFVLRSPFSAADYLVKKWIVK